MGAGTSKAMFQTTNYVQTNGGMGHFTEEEQQAEFDRKANQEKAAKYVVPV